MLLTLILAGCALPEKSMPKLPFEPMEFTEKTFTISEIVHIEDYLARIPDRQVDIDVHNTLKLRDFISVLTAAGINIIANISPETEITVPKYSGDIKPLLKGIQESHGLHFYFSNNTLSIREKAAGISAGAFPRDQRERHSPCTVLRRRESFLRCVHVPGGVRVRLHHLHADQGLFRRCSHAELRGHGRGDNRD